MSFLEKHYPQVGHARILLEQRLRHLQNQHQQLAVNRIHTEHINHQTHHHQLQSNIINLYDLVRKTAENQSSMQTEMNMMRNKSVGNLTYHQIEHKQRVHHLENAYRIAEEKANSLHKRIQNYYPRLLKRQYHSRLERYPLGDVENQIDLRKEKLEYDWKQQYEKRLQLNNQHNVVREDMELHDLHSQRQQLSMLLRNEEKSRRCVQENMRLKKIYESIGERLPTAQFNYRGAENEDIVSKYYDTGILSDYQTAKSQSYEVDRDLVNNVLRSPTSKIGKIYARQARKQNQSEDIGNVDVGSGIAEVIANVEVDIRRESQLMSGDNSIRNETKIVHDTHDQIQNNTILIEQGSSQIQKSRESQNDKSMTALNLGNKSISGLKTKPNNSVLSHSLTQSKFRTKIDHRLLQQSESNSDSQQPTSQQPKNEPNHSLSRSLSKSKTKKSPYKLDYQTYSKSTLRPSSSILKKRYQANNQQQIYSNVLQRTFSYNLGINNRIQNSYTIFQNSTFKNTKHEHTNLYSRYNLENKLRKDVKDKLAKHRVAESKYGLI